MTEPVNISLDKDLIKIIRDNSSFLSPVRTTLIPKTTKLHNIKCVLFDVYGTLFISGAGDISHSAKSIKRIEINSLLTSFNFTINDNEAGELAEKLFYTEIKLSHKKANANGQNYPEVDVVEIWHSVLEKLIMDGKISGHLKAEDLRSFALRYELGKNPVWPMPNLEETLEFIRKSKVLLGIVSNAQFFTPLLFEALLNTPVNDLGFNRSLLFWSYKYKVAKPSLELFDLASSILQKQFSISPEDTLYVGNDMLNDIKPAYCAGFKTALFAGDNRSLRTRENLADLKGISPSVIITDLIQLCEIIA